MLWWSLAVLAVLFLAGMVVNRAIEWAVDEHPYRHQVDWRHVAELEKEVYGEVRSPEAMNLSLTPKMDARFGVSGKQAGEALAQTFVSKPHGPWTVGHRQPRLTTSIVLTEDADPSLALDPAYEWVACPRLGSRDIRYVRGARKWT